MRRPSTSYPTCLSRWAFMNCCSQCNGHCIKKHCLIEWSWRPAINLAPLSGPHNLYHSESWSHTPLSISLLVISVYGLQTLMCLFFTSAHTEPRFSFFLPRPRLLHREERILAEWGTIYSQLGPKECSRSSRYKASAFHNETTRVIVLQSQGCSASHHSVSYCSIIRLCERRALIQ